MMTTGNLQGSARAAGGGEPRRSRRCYDLADIAAYDELPHVNAVSTPIESEGTDTRDDERHHEVPPALVCRSSVQQHDRQAASAVVDDVKAKTRAGEGPIGQRDPLEPSGT